MHLCKKELLNLLAVGDTTYACLSFYSLSMVRLLLGAK